jgi:SAM-dependent methyltransferase
MGLSLDVGCGKLKRGTIGVDLDRNSVADVISDAHHLPFKEACFSKVVSITVLEHSPNPLEFLKEQYRVLKPNGTVEVTTDNAQYFAWSVMNFGRGGDRHDTLADGHCMIFYPQNVEFLLQKASFTVKSREMIARKTKLDLIVNLLIRLSIWRKDCRFFRFKITAQK